MKVAFDVDDTLIIPACVTGFPIDTPNYEVINIFRFFQAQGHEMIIWSGSGVDWARRWAEKLGLEATIRMKQKSDDIDICFDDCDVDLAKVNIRVKRIKNSISREESNKRDHIEIMSQEMVHCNVCHCEHYPGDHFCRPVFNVVCSKCHGNNPVL